MSYNPLLNDGCNVFYRPYRKKMSLLEGGIIEYDVKRYRQDDDSNNPEAFYYWIDKWHFYNPCTLSNGPTAWGKDQENPSYNYRFYCNEIGLFPKSTTFTHHGSGNLECRDGYWMLVNSNGDWIPPTEEPIEGEFKTWEAKENFMRHYRECYYMPRRREIEYAVPFHPCGGGVCNPTMKIMGSRIYPSGYSNCGDPEETDLHNHPCTPNTIEYNHWIPNPNNLLGGGPSANLGPVSISPGGVKIGGGRGGGIDIGIDIGAGVFFPQKIWTKPHPNKDHCVEVWRMTFDFRTGPSIGAKYGKKGLKFGGPFSIKVPIPEKVTDLCSDRGCPPPLIQDIQCGRYQEPSGCCSDNLISCDRPGFICCYNPEDCSVVKSCRV